MNTFITLSPFDLALATGFVVIAAMLSIILRLGVEKRLLIAATRTAIQLTMVGFVLKIVFGLDNPFFVIGLLFFMAIVAGREASARARRRYAGMIFDTTISMASVAFFVGAIVTQVILDVKPWYHPQYVIPLLGLLLGNSLNGISLALDTFLDYLASRRSEIELFLAYGADRNEALQNALRAAVKRGLVPIINAMSVAGVVSLPGMMTGQILAGVPPLQAVAYQILIMFMLAGSYSLGATSVVYLAGKRLLGRELRLRQEILN